MDIPYQQCLSNIAFMSISMSAFLVARKRLYITNAFSSRAISPMCSTLLGYESRSGIRGHEHYLRRLAVYMVIQSGLVLLEQKYPQYLTPKITIPTKPQSQQTKYTVSTSKIANPIIFALIFRLPIVMGLGLGLAANHVSCNMMEKVREMLQ